MFCSRKRNVGAAKHSVGFKGRGLYSILLTTLILANGHIIPALPAGVSSVNDTSTHLVAYPSPGVEFIVGPQVRSGSEPLAAWYDAVAARQAKYWAEKFLAEPLLVVSNHYDLPLCLYTEYYRTGDPEYQRLARLVAEKWWKGPNINSGLPVEGGSIPPPMYVGFLGLMLYAMDTGDPLIWGHLDRITREWMDIRLLGKIAAPDIYTDLRDEGYILLSAVTLARVLPDSYPMIVWDNQLNTRTIQITDGAARRLKYLADCENVAVNYFGRLQEADGSWRWRQWNPAGVSPNLVTIIEAELAAGRSDKMEQPFMAGIYMEAAVALHRLTQNTAVKAALQSQMTRHAEHLMRDAYIVNQTDGLTSMPRVLLYFYPKVFAAYDPTASDRHLTASVIHTFGYAYQITGDPKFKEWGDELWDSCFAVNPSDGYRSGLDQFYHLKLFTAEFRSSGRYLAWRGGATATPAPVTVNITTPTHASTLTAGSSINITAAAASSDSIISRVDFYADGQFIGATAVAPYNVSWGGAGVGTHVLTAKATDGRGVSSMSSPVTVNVAVAVNSLPSVRITGPASNAEFIEGADVSIGATAADGDGSIARVDFYAGTQFIGATATSPYTVLWNRVPAGTYTLTAIATDNAGGKTTSAPVSIKVVRSSKTARSGGGKGTKGGAKVTSSTIAQSSAPAQSSMTASAETNFVGYVVPTAGANPPRSASPSAGRRRTKLSRLSQ